MQSHKSILTFLSSGYFLTSFYCALAMFLKEARAFFYWTIDTLPSVSIFSFIDFLGASEVICVLIESNVGFEPLLLRSSTCIFMFFIWFNFLVTQACKVLLVFSKERRLISSSFKILSSRNELCIFCQLVSKGWKISSEKLKNSVFYPFIDDFAF